MVRLTREQLYALVWDKPMRTLAGEFGLSDVALHKICRKHSVPTPPVGYWAKKAHGKRVSVTPLPTAEDGDRPIVIHEGAATHESEAMSAARVVVRERLSAPGKPNLERHAIVERTIARLEKARPDRFGMIRAEGRGMVPVTVRPDSIERAGRLLDQLVHAATRAGLQLDARNGPAHWTVEGKTIAFELVELPDKVAHVATEKELAAHAKWEREREEHHRRYGYWRDWGEPKIPKWEDRYQGRLAFRLEEVRVRSEGSWWGHAIRRQFADRSNRDAANDIPRVVETIAAIAVAKRENRELEERRRREAEKRERQRIEAERRRLVEEKRAQAAEQLMSEQAEAERAARLIAMLERLPERPPRVAALLAWARERRARQVERLSAQALEERLAEARLFVDDVEQQRDGSPAAERAFNF